MESFLLHRVNPEEVNSMGLRVRVYGCERMRRERLIGESIVSFATIDLELETNLWLSLEPRANATVIYLNMHRCKIANRNLNFFLLFFVPNIPDMIVEWVDQRLTQFSTIGQHRVDNVYATWRRTRTVISFSIQWNDWPFDR